jgi:hypothetical protein
MLLKEKEFQKDLVVAEAELEKIKSESIKNIALAEAAEAGTQIKDYQVVLDGINSKLDSFHTLKKLDQEMEIHKSQQEAKNEQSTASPPVAPTPPDEAVS